MKINQKLKKIENKNLNYDLSPPNLFKKLSLMDLFLGGDKIL